jgi:hypothetical protein
LRDVSVTCGRNDGALGRPTGLAGWWWNRMVWELRAIYMGHPVVLYSSSNQTTFGQVRRALIRALEANHP